MRFAPAYVAAALSLAACGGGGDFVDGGPDTPSIESVEPNYGPVAGGTRVIITGDGFERENAAPNRVVFGTREAPLAQAIDDDHLEVVVPETDSPGAVDIIVFNSNGHASASGQFHYSDLPAISEVNPGTVRYDMGGTVTVTGSGFLDEGAGPVTVLLDGNPAFDVAVTSDSELSFTALPGRVFDEPDVRIINNRGEALEPDGFQYGPGPGGGLVIWPGPLADTYALYVDPVTLTVERFPRLARGDGGPSVPFYRAVVQDATGDFIAQDRQNNRLFTIDFADQDASAGAAVAFRISEMERVGSTFYVINRDGGPSFGSIDTSNGQFTQIGSGNVLGGPTSLAADSAGNLFIIQGNGANVQVSSISRTTGALGSAVNLTGNPHIVSSRFIGSTLYGIDRGGTVYQINPTTGATTTIVSTGTNVRSMTAVQ